MVALRPESSKYVLKSENIWGPVGQCFLGGTSRIMPDTINYNVCLQEDESNDNNSDVEEDGLFLVPHGYLSNDEIGSDSEEV